MMKTFCDIVSKRGTSFKPPHIAEQFDKGLTNSILEALFSIRHVVELLMFSEKSSFREFRLLKPKIPIKVIHE